MPRERIPVVADEAIDPEFGTGVLKVTPAHDKVDFEVGSVTSCRLSMFYILMEK